jgi:hypothetical protein
MNLDKGTTSFFQFFCKLEMLEVRNYGAKKRVNTQSAKYFTFQSTVYHF